MAFRTANARSLQDIMNATNADLGIFPLAEKRLVAVYHDEDEPWGLPFKSWLDGLAVSDQPQDDVAAHATRLSLAVTFLRVRAHDEVTSLY